MLLTTVKYHIRILYPMCRKRILMVGQFGMNKEFQLCKVQCRELLLKNGSWWMSRELVYWGNKELLLLYHQLCKIQTFHFQVTKLIWKLHNPSNLFSNEFRLLRTFQNLLYRSCLPYQRFRCHNSVFKCHKIVFILVRVLVELDHP